MFVALAGKPNLHETGRAFRNDHFFMRGDVIAVRVGDKGEWLRIPRIQPNTLVRKKDPAIVLHRNHIEILANSYRSR